MYIELYLQHSLQLPSASYVSVNRLRHISMYVFLPSSLSVLVSSELRSGAKNPKSYRLYKLFTALSLKINSVAATTELFQNELETIERY